MKIIIALFSCLAVFPANVAVADQWGSRVMAECYDNLIGHNPEHLFIRVFHTEIGGGQLEAPDGQSEGVLSLEHLDRAPFSCVVQGRTVRFELQDYRPTRQTGACAQCEHTGFLLSVDGAVTWKTPAPAEIGGFIFNGTIDLDRDIARICTEHREEASGDFFEGRRVVLTCLTIPY